MSLTTCCRDFSRMLCKTLWWEASKREWLMANQLILELQCKIFKISWISILAVKKIWKTKYLLPLEVNYFMFLLFENATRTISFGQDYCILSFSNTLNNVFSKKGTFIIMMLCFSITNISTICLIMKMWHEIA